MHITMTWSAFLKQVQQRDNSDAVLPERIELPETASTADLLGALAASSARSALFKDSGVLRSGVMLYIDGQVLRQRDEPRPLHDGQSCSVMTLIAGG